MKIVAFIQARFGSTRLPGKVLRKIHGQTVLGHIIERAVTSKKLDDVIVATSTLSQDDATYEEIQRNGVRSFRGSENDVLNRFYQAAKEAHADVCVRITADNLFTDIHALDLMFNEFVSKKFDYMTTNKFLPLGAGSEVFHFESLEKSQYEATLPYEREHVTPYMAENGHLFSTGIASYTIDNTDFSKIRLTLDTLEDWKLCNIIFDTIYQGIPLLTQDVVHTFELYPHWHHINSNIIQRQR